MALPHFMYRDPCEVLERKQESELKKGCKGCVHEFEVEFKNQRVLACDMNKSHGNRCRFYKLKESGNEK